MPDMDGLEQRGDSPLGGPHGTPHRDRRFTGARNGEDRKRFLDAAPMAISPNLTPEQLHAVIALMRPLTDKHALPRAS